MKKLNSKEVKSLLTAIDDLIDIKVLIRKIVPEYNLTNSNNNLFLSKLENLNRKLEPIFSKYLKNETISTKESDLELKELISKIIKEETLVLISANSAKKKLKNLGVNARNLIVTGGPLFVQDYKVINPNLTEKALEGIKKKCDKLFEDLKSIEWLNKDLIFIREKNNPTDSLILNQLSAINDVVGKEIQSYELNSWDELDEI
ncbi:MAG: DUF2100 domain-containing protein [Candidatus Hermodarchaeota archaeon]